MTKPRLLLADDHRLVREGMRSLLEADYEVVAEAGDGRELVRDAIELSPDVIIADIGMTEMGEILHISARTVERHKYSLMDKLKLRTTAELTQYAIKRGLVSPP